MWPRVRALVRKELIDIARNRAALVPVGIVALMSLALPFAIAVLVPALTGKPLSGDADMLRLAARLEPGGGQLGPEGRIQAFLFEQFLVLFLLTPVTGAMALAAHAVVGEKQARTLEPLLATPITTRELLVAKVLGALLPTAAITIIALVLFAGGIEWLALPGVAARVFGARTFVLVCGVGTTIALVSLQTAILISSRVNDARTAQQFGVLIIVPLTAVLVAQLTGTAWLSTRTLLVATAGLFVLWILLTMLSVAVFDRESILTRWR
ncbi:MAG: ABC transporter permease subunit [Betaproteobacteria bacterium]